MKLSRLRRRGRVRTGVWLGLTVALALSGVSPASADAGPPDQKKDELTEDRVEAYLRSANGEELIGLYFAASQGSERSAAERAELLAIAAAGQVRLQDESGLSSDPASIQVTWVGGPLDVVQFGGDDASQAANDYAGVNVFGFNTSVGVPYSGGCNGYTATGFHTKWTERNLLKSCYYKYKVAEGDPHRDLWAYSRVITAEPLDRSWRADPVVKNLYAYSRLTNGSVWKVSNYARYAVSPAGDGEKGCDSTPVTVSVGWASFGRSLTWCDHWDVRSYGEHGSNGARYRIKFSVSSFWAEVGSRSGKYQEVGFTNMVWVRRGTQPYWYDWSSATVCERATSNCVYDTWSG